MKLPRPGPPGPTTLDNKDPYDDYDELKKTMTRESFVLNGKLLDDFVGDGRETGVQIVVSTSSRSVEEDECT